MDAYYILKIDRFNHQLNQYNTNQQTGLPGYYDDEPCIKFAKDTNNILISGCQRYDLITERCIKQCGRALGTDDIFEQFISISSSKIFTFPESDLLILHCSKDIFNQFIKLFKTDSDFRFSKINVNFDHIIVDQKFLGIEGIWLGKIEDVNLNALFLLGNKVEDSEKYHEFRDAGAEISNITIIYDYNNTRKKIMITKDGGIIFYNAEPETDSILLVKHIFEKLLS